MAPDARGIPRLFVGNFDFEHQLAGEAFHRRAGVERAMRELALVWAAIADDGDVVWSPARLDDAFLADLAALGLPRLRPAGDERHIGTGTAVCPWGWTDAIRDWSDKHGWTCDAPPQSAVRDINSRDFSFRLEQDWDLAPEGVAAVSSLDELAAALGRLPPECDRWVVKARFGMSARERIVGAGRALAPAARKWVRARLAADSRLFLEPWLDRIAEAGLQFSIPRTGEPLLLGVTPLLTGASGVYRGSRFHVDAAVPHDWHAAIATGRLVADEAQKAGYFGPLGIDAMIYRNTGGQTRVRAIQDVNARYTMGRLSLGFRRLLKAGEKGSWLHVRFPVDHAAAPRRFCEQLTARLPNETRLIRTSPLTVDGLPVAHGTLLVVAPTDEILARAEREALRRPSEHSSPDWGDGWAR